MKAILFQKVSALIEHQVLSLLTLSVLPQTLPLVELSLEVERPPHHVVLVHGCDRCLVVVIIGVHDVDGVGGVEGVGNVGQVDGDIVERVDGAVPVAQENPTYQATCNTAVA